MDEVTPDLCPDCNRPTGGKTARGVCINCYHRHWRHGTHVTLPTPGRRKPPPRTEKPCSACGIVKPLAEFISAGERRDGKGSHCLECRKVRYYTTPRDLNASAPQTSGGVQECATCGAAKPEEDFAWSVHVATRRKTCKACVSERVKSRRERDPDRFRDQALRSKYGISLRDFEAMLATQGGACAICGSPASSRGKSFAVDHCHATGRVRGILCGKCNSAIGLFGDDADRLEKAVTYLRAG